MSQLVEEHRHRPLGRAGRGPAGRLPPACSASQCACSPAGRDPTRPTLPLHLRPLAQPRGCSTHNPRTGDRHSRSGVAAATLRPGSRQDNDAASPTSQHPSFASAGGHHRRTWTSSSGDGSVTLILRSPATRTSRSGDDAENLPDRAEGRPPPGPPGAPRGRRGHGRHVMDLLIAKLGVNDSEVYRLPAPAAGPHRAQPRRRPRASRAALPAVRPKKPANCRL